MKIRFNKILTLSLCLALSVSLMSPAFAAEGGTNQTSPIKLTTQPIVFNVGVPTGFAIHVDEKGGVTTPTNVSIENKSAAPITITNVQVNPITDWSVVPMNKDFKGTQIGTKEFGFILNSDEVPTNGTVSLTKANWPSINGGSSLPLTYDSVVAPQRDAITGNKIADVIFTIGWDAVEAETPTEPEIKYVLATDSDFSGETDGRFKYIGTEEYVEIPHVIKGVPVTSYSGMFKETSVQGVKSTNLNVTNMEQMFTGSQATILDLSSFNTSNVTNMSDMFNDSRATSLDLSKFDTSKVTDMQYMFQKSQATVLDLSSFDTSKVTDMNNMFANSQATVLDLSSFDTSNVTNMINMFYNSKAATGYARIQEEADKFNASSNKPSTLTFVVK